MNREAAMQALLTQVTSKPAVFSFSANLIQGSTALASVSDTSGLFQGLPLFGTGVPDGATLASVSPPAMSLPAASTQTAVTITQGFVTRGVNPDGSRTRLPFWSDIAAQPAIYVDDGDEQHPERHSGMPTKFVLEAEIWLFYDAGETGSTTPMSVMNALIAAVEKTLAPQPPSEPQTLGGNVVHCQIEGHVIKGRVQGQAVVMLPAKMLVQQTF